LSGEVWNNAEGVAIRVWGEAADRRRFISGLRAESPPLARIDDACAEPLN
jgi:hydrogenase maturation protein HypF